MRSPRAGGGKALPLPKSDFQIRVQTLMVTNLMGQPTPCWIARVVSIWVEVLCVVVFFFLVGNASEQFERGRNCPEGQSCSSQYQCLCLYNSGQITAFIIVYLHNDLVRQVEQVQGCYLVQCCPSYLCGGGGLQEKFEEAPLSQPINCFRGGLTMGRPISLNCS